MRLTRWGSHRWCGTTTIVDRKPSEIKELSFIFHKVPDFNSDSHHDYTLRFSDEELDLLLNEREKRIHRENLAGSVLLKNANGNSEAKERLWALLDQHLVEDRDRQLFGLKPRGQ